MRFFYPPTLDEQAIEASPGVQHASLLGLRISLKSKPSDVNAKEPKDGVTPKKPI